MFENLVKQNARKFLITDLKRHSFPGAVLFSGNEASGKLTAALETARILTCKSETPGLWTCDCSSCLQNKSLTTSNLLLMGPRDCSMEIEASKDTFIKAYRDNASYLPAARYLFIRSIRKLTLRFNGILWQNEKNLSKIGSLIEEINELLEVMDFPKVLPQFDDCVKKCDKLVSLAADLEGSYLYDSIPINQVRNMENWAWKKTEEGKKTVIIENADRMLPGVRNALLKILEEPPADTIFILLSSKRNAMMQTILSRVRTYNFKERTLTEQKEVITRVFHNEYFNGSINEYLLTYLPVPPSELKKQAERLFSAISQRQIPDLSDIVKCCNSFNPRLELRLFLKYFTEMHRKLMKTQAGSEICSQCMILIRKCWDNVSLYNQTPQSALETLLKDISMINVRNGYIYK